MHSENSGRISPWVWRAETEIWPFCSAIEMSRDTVSSFRKQNKIWHKSWAGGWGEQGLSTVRKWSPFKELKPRWPVVKCKVLQCARWAGTFRWMRKDPQMPAWSSGRNFLHILPFNGEFKTDVSLHVAKYLVSWLQSGGISEIYNYFQQLPIIPIELFIFIIFT